MSTSLEAQSTIVRGNLPALTTMRFVAASMIVIGHGADQFGSLGLSSIPLNQGVSFFFVLSGFILAYNYQSFKNLRQVGRFLLARFARIWPLHIACLGLFLIILPRELWYVPYPTPTLLTLLVFDVLLVQAWIPFKQVILSLNGVAWSISAELFFYIVFPLLVVLRRARPWLLGTSVLACVVTVVLVTQNGVSFDQNAQGLSALGLLYTNPLVRLLEFQTGIATAMGFLSLRSHAVGFAVGTALEAAAVLLAAATLVAMPHLQGFLVSEGGVGPALGFWAVNNGAFPAFALLIFVTARHEGAISKAMSLPPLTLLGEVSFAVYLFHAILLRCWMAQLTLFHRLSLPGQYIIFWTLLLSASLVLHFSVERPCRHLIVSFGKKG